MSEMDAIRRTNEDITDFYQTLPCQIDCLCQYLDLGNKSVIDAGSGKEVIANGIRRNHPTSSVYTAEKNPGHGVVIPSKENLFSFDTPTPGNGVETFKYPIPNYTDFLEVNRRFDYVISNPPYSQKDAFIKKALSISDNVFMLFPLQILNYIEICETWLDIPEYCGRITMYPKVILNPQCDYIQGGNTGYAWFHWSGIDIPDRNFNKYEIFEDIRKYR